MRGLYVQKLFKSLSDKLNKSFIVFNASTDIGNANERLRDNLSVIVKNAIKENRYINMIKKLLEERNQRLISPTFTNNLPADGSKSVNLLPHQIDHWWKWYQQVTGLDLIDSAKHQIITVQEKLFECQDRRRQITQEALVRNEKLKEIYSEMIQTKRDDPKYVQLTITENKNLQELSKLNDILALLENEERDHFTHLATSIKEYHDSQAMNAQKYKYLSILASSIIAIVSLIASIIYNNKRIVDIRTGITDAQNIMESHLNEKLSVILNKIDGQEKNFATPVVAQNLVNEDTQFLFKKSKENNAILFKIDETTMYVGVGILTAYLILQIIR